MEIEYPFNQYQDEQMTKNLPFEHRPFNFHCENQNFLENQKQIKEKSNIDNKEVKKTYEGSQKQKSQTRLIVNSDVLERGNTNVSMISLQVEQSHPNLKFLKLKLCRSNWGDDQIKQFCFSLKQCKNLEELNIDLSMNGISDRGSVILASTIGNLLYLEKISLNLQQNILKKNSLCVLEALNSLTQIKDLSIDVRGNTILLEQETQHLLLTFKNVSVFHSILNLEIQFDQFSQQSQQINEGNLLTNGEIKSQIEISKNVEEQIQKQISCCEKKLKKLEVQSHLMSQNRQLNHPQHEIILSQISQTKSKLQQLFQNHFLTQQHSQQIIEEEIIKKADQKASMSRLLEIMLKYTINLKRFSLKCPGQLMDKQTWECLGDLLIEKSCVLEQFNLSILSLTNLEIFSDVGYVMYQIEKIKSLSTISLRLSDLSITNSLFLSLFLSDMPNLRNLSLQLPSIDVFSNQKDLLIDLCNFYKSLKAPLLSSLELDLSYSCIDNILAENLLSQLVNPRNSLESFTVNLRSCMNILDNSMIILLQSLIFQKSLKFLKIDIGNTKISPMVILETLPQLNPSLLSLSLNLYSPPLNISKSLQQSLISSIFPLQKLTSCIITLSKDTSNYSKILRQRAIQTKRLIQMIQLLKQHPLTNIFRKDLYIHFVEYLLPQSRNSN